jgi:hypothetical protein
MDLNDPTVPLHEKIVHAEKLVAQYKQDNDNAVNAAMKSKGAYEYTKAFLDGLRVAEGATMGANPTADPDGTPQDALPVQNPDDPADEPTV